ncbi:MAG TPA: hypothetical protein VII23_25300 [Terriglobales bacterium]
MDFLNSQHLTSHDSFVHLFSDAGDFTYFASVSDYVQGKQGTITVQKAETAVGKGKQHEVVFHWDKSTRGFVPREEDMKKSIQTNDFVLFRFCRAEPGQPTCFILGHRGDKKVEFDSRHLRTQQAFMHFFLTAGEHSYRLGRGTYQVSVTDHRDLEVEEHQKRASQAVVIVVSGDQPSPKHANIVTGQTVIWAVEKGENVSIEDQPYKPGAAVSPPSVAR